MSAAAVIQLFDWRFDQVARAVPELAALGYSHLHVSPPQASNEAVWQWWGRYQPTGYTIGGPLGSAAAFARMARIADGHGLAVVADVVGCNPCGRRDLLCGVALSEPAAAFRAGLDYLTALTQLGARGFRFDAAGSIPPAFFRWALPLLGDALVFGEIVTDRCGDLQDYCAVPGVRLLDFPLLAAMRDAFAPGGDLRTLRAPARHGRALAAAAAVTFVRNHDIERGQESDKGIEDGAYRARFGLGWDEAAQRLDRAAVDLAHAFLFARRDGIPYALAAMRTLPEAARRDRHDDAMLAAGLRFRARCAALGDPAETWRVETAETIAWQRGSDAFAVINKSARAFDLAALPTSLRPGLHRDFRSGVALLVAADGRIAAGHVAGRTAALFLAGGEI